MQTLNVVIPVCWELSESHPCKYYNMHLARAAYVSCVFSWWGSEIGFSIFLSNVSDDNCAVGNNCIMAKLSTNLTVYNGTEFSYVIILPKFFSLSQKIYVFFLNCTKALWIKPCCMTQINIAAGFQFLVSFLHWRTEVAKECIQTILNESQVRRWWWAHCGSLSWNLDAVCDGAPALVGFKVRGTIGEFSLNNGCSNFLFY